jgi:methionine-gamma-lyase
LGAGDHIVSSRTIYGGTYAFLKTSRQDLISKTFVDITKLDAVEAAITSDTVLYCETVSNPLLEVADIAGLSKSPKHNLKLVVDNTFSPLSVSPVKFMLIL